jgi:sugar (pentulose or hexulose) kinase
MAASGGKAEKTMRYAIGIDFGTESGRAVIVDLADGREVGTAVCQYANGVIDEALPLEGTVVRLEPDWALLDPDDLRAQAREERARCTEAKFAAGAPAAGTAGACRGGSGEPATG